MDQSLILIIAPPERRRESLVSMTSTLAGSIAIRVVDTCSQAKDISLPQLPTLILIGYRSHNEEIENEIKAIEKQFSTALVVLMRSRLFESNTSIHITNQEVVYEDISIDVLYQLLSTATHTPKSIPGS